MRKFKEEFEKFWEDYSRYLVFDEEFTPESHKRETLEDVIMRGGYETIETVQTWVRNTVYLYHKDDVYAERFKAITDLFQSLANLVIMANGGEI